MSDKLYTKILRDATKLNPPPKTFIPMLTGEPFLDPQMVDRIKEAQTALPKTEIHLYTNGCKLTEEIIRKLAEVPQFHLNISVNGASVETRKRLTGLGDYEYVARMIDYIDSLHISHSVSLVQHPSITKEEEKAFNRRWGKATSSSSCRSPYVFQHLNFAGLTYRKDQIRFTHCIHATSHMTVLWDGRVNLCCMDPLGKKICGDLNHQTVSEVCSPKSVSVMPLCTMRAGERSARCAGTATSSASNQGRAALENQGSFKEPKMGQRAEPPG
jgi:sulfatase maturation enzyme AslB (radical SAM superfamily)